MVPNDPEAHRQVAPPFADTSQGSNWPVGDRCPASSERMLFGGHRGPWLHFPEFPASGRRILWRQPPWESEGSGGGEGRGLTAELEQHICSIFSPTTIITTDSQVSVRQYLTTPPPPSHHPLSQIPSLRNPTTSPPQDQFYLHKA